MSADDNEVEFRRHAIGYWLILVENAPDKASAETTALERIVIRWREEGTADNHLETLIYDSDDRVRYAAAAMLGADSAAAVLALDRLVSSRATLVGPTAQLLLSRWRQAKA